MMRSSLLALVILIFAVSLHFIANFTGVYDMQIEAGFVWIDNVIHFLIGIAFGFFGFGLVEKYKPESSLVFQVVFVFGFVLFSAVGWEIIEFAFLKLFTSYALSLQIYSPSVIEAVTDICSNLAGALTVIGWMTVFKR